MRRSPPATARNVLVSLLAFLGLGALGGGGVLLFSPDGRAIGLPLSLLVHSPFHTFLIPGVVLFVVLGIVPSGLVFALLTKPENALAERWNYFGDMHWAWTATIYVAFALIAWIQIEMMLLRAVHWLHAFYTFLAVAILFVALSPPLRDEFKKER